MVHPFLCLSCRHTNSIPSNSGFTITLYEYKRTIESLWSTVHGMLHLPVHSACSLIHAFPPCADFVAEHPEYVVPNNAMNFLSDNGGTDYNLCHCTSFSVNLTREAGP